MAGDQPRVGTGQLLKEVNCLNHALDRAATGLRGEGIAEVAVEILDVDHVGGLSEVLCLRHTMSSEKEHVCPSLSGRCKKRTLPRKRRCCPLYPRSCSTSW